jgi:hypothetical protein
MDHSDHLLLELAIVLVGLEPRQLLAFAGRSLLNSDEPESILWELEVLRHQSEADYLGYVAVGAEFAEQVLAEAGAISGGPPGGDIRAELSRLLDLHHDRRLAVKVSCAVLRMQREPVCRWLALRTKLKPREY